MIVDYNKYGTHTFNVVFTILNFTLRVIGLFLQSFLISNNTIIPQCKNIIQVDHFIQKHPFIFMYIM